MDFNRYLTEKKHLVEKELDLLVGENSEIPVITEAMRYSLLAGGKRLRPILAIMSSELLAAVKRRYFPLPAASK